MKTVLAIAQHTAALKFIANPVAAPFGYNIAIQYAPHAYEGALENVYNVDTVDWLFNIKQGLTGKNSGEVNYESSKHGFGGCLRFFDYIDGKLLERFTAFTITVALKMHKDPTN